MKLRQSVTEKYAEKGKQDMSIKPEFFPGNVEYNIKVALAEQALLREFEEGENRVTSSMATLAKK